MTARRAVALLAASLVVLGTTSGCGLRDRAGTAGEAVTPAEVSAETQTSRAELPDQAPSPEGGATAPSPTTLAQQPAGVTEAQVRAVEAAVGAAAKAVSQGEAEVASDG